MVPDAAPPCPRAALKVAESACGGPLEPKEISDRRGSTVWKAAGPDGAVAVKTGSGDGASVTIREAAVLAALDIPGYALGSGRDDGVSWLVTRWLTGPSTWKSFEPVRRSTDDHNAALARAAALCRAVAELHASGWASSPPTASAPTTGGSSTSRGLGTL
ncbi:hypothetical protein ACIOWG_09875 [Streptomyces sp. NPDC087658]|uniref:hypothetical protein n=1 Tax=Streptomyces sp. NPDC087658 TaxID=3365800 RepID=UPI003810E23B